MSILLFLGEADIHIDGTFILVPGMFYQLLTIHVVLPVNGRRRVRKAILLQLFSLMLFQSYPIAFFLMTWKTKIYTWSYV